MTHPQWLIEFERKLYEKNVVVDALAQFEDRTGVPRLYIVLGMIGVNKYDENGFNYNHIHELAIS